MKLKVMMIVMMTVMVKLKMNKLPNLCELCLRRVCWKPLELAKLCPFAPAHPPFQHHQSEHARQITLVGFLVGLPVRS